MVDTNIKKSIEMKDCFTVLFFNHFNTYLKNVTLYSNIFTYINVKY